MFSWLISDYQDFLGKLEHDHLFEGNKGFFWDYFEGTRVISTIKELLPKNIIRDQWNLNIGNKGEKVELLKDYAMPPPPLPHHRLVCWQEPGSRSFSRTCLSFAGSLDTGHASSFLKPKEICRTFLLLRPLPYHLPSTWIWQSHWSMLHAREMTLCSLVWICAQSLEEIKVPQRLSNPLFKVYVNRHHSYGAQSSFIWHWQVAKKYHGI